MKFSIKDFFSKCDQIRSFLFWAVNIFYETETKRNRNIFIKSTTYKNYLKTCCKNIVQHTSALLKIILCLDKNKQANLKFNILCGFYVKQNIAFKTAEAMTVLCVFGITCYNIYCCLGGSVRRFQQYLFYLVL